MARIIGVRIGITIGVLRYIEDSISQELKRLTNVSTASPILSTAKQYVWSHFLNPPLPPQWLSLGSSVLLDPHLSQQHVGLQHKDVWRLQKWFVQADCDNTAVANCAVFSQTVQIGRR